VVSAVLQRLLLLAPLAACAHRAAEPPAQPRLPGARFSLDLVNARVRSRDELRADFVLTNTGTVPLWVNGRMLLGPGRSTSPFNEVWVEANGPGAIRWWCFFRTPAVQPKHYRLLSPGDSAGRGASGPSEDLRCLGLDAPGIYSLIAHFKDGNDPVSVPPAPPGSVYLGWELVSEPVAVEITEGSAHRAAPETHPPR
jgi:hypothetical protein